MLEEEPLVIIVMSIIILLVQIMLTEDGKMQQEPNAGGNIEVQLKMNGIKMQDGNAKILDGMTQIFMNSSIIIRIISNKFKH